MRHARSTLAALTLVSLLLAALSATAIAGVPVDETAQLVLAKDAGGSAEVFAIRSAASLSDVPISEAVPYTVPYDFAGQKVAFSSEDLTEILTAAQVAAGWTLVDASCTNAADSLWSDWTFAAGTLSVTIRPGDDITCTWVNALAVETPAPTPAPTPAASELPDAATATATGTPQLPLMGLVMVFAVVALVATRVVRKHR